MFDPDSFRHTHEKILKAIGAEHIRFHDLRHPYVKHTTKKFSCKSRNPKPSNVMVWGFCFCLFNLRNIFDIECASLCLLIFS